MDNGVASQKVRALGEMLNTLVGQDVIILGNVVDVHSGGSSMKLCTSDKVNINVSFDSNLDEMPSGWVQVTGSVVGPNAITAVDMWPFRGSVKSEEPSNSNFDADTYNDAVRALNELKHVVNAVNQANSANNGENNMDTF